MIRAMIVKDVLLLVRDRGTLVSLFLLPIVFMAAFGAMFRAGPDRGRPQTIAIHDARGTSIASTLAATPGFAVSPADSPALARAAVVASHATAAIIVPVDGPIELSLDTAMAVQMRGPLEGALRGAITYALGPPVAPPAIEVVAPAGLARPKVVSAFQVTVPGNAVLFGFFIALTVAMAFATDRRTGTWRRLLASPLPRWHALLATLVPYFAISVLQAGFLLGIGVVAFGMEVAGSPVALVAVSLAVSYCAVSLGLLLAAVANSERQLGAIGSVLLLVMGLLGGCMFPRISMSSTMQTIGLAVPHGWALEAYETVLLRTGASLMDVGGPLVVLGAFGTAFAIAGIAMFRFER